MAKKVKDDSNLQLYLGKLWVIVYLEGLITHEWIISIINFMAEIPLVLKCPRNNAWMFFISYGFNFNDDLSPLIQVDSILQICYISLWLLSTWDPLSTNKELKINTNFDHTARAGDINAVTIYRYLFAKRR